MTIEVGGSGGGLIMPELSVEDVDLTMKSDVAVTPNSALAAFWTAFDLDYTIFGWTTASLNPVSNTTEQTIVDTTGQGVLTHVVGSALGASGFLTIRITIDGVLKTFISPTIPDEQRFILGHFMGWAAASSTVNLGGGQDKGYNTTPKIAMITPNQAITENRIGMIFKTSLKVTVQGSVNISSFAETKKSGVAYTLLIPEGLS